MRQAYMLIFVLAAACGGQTRADVVALSMASRADATAPSDASQESGAAVSVSDADSTPPRVTSPGCTVEGPGVTNCGAASESCCTSLEVNGGTFYRTYGSGADGGVEVSTEADPATVSSFRLDKYDVTVGRFRRFVNAWTAGYTPPEGSGKHTHLNGGNGLLAVGDDAGTSYEPGWIAADDMYLAPTSANLVCSGDTSGPGFSTWTDVPGANENKPIGCANWYEAYAFCIWDGGFLPSETEGGYASYGGDEQREYPWGSAPPGTTNQYAIYECYYPDGGPGECENVSSVAPVGTAPLGAGRWGQLDLTGNTQQWELDYLYASNTGVIPEVEYYVNPCVDCAYLAATTSTSALTSAYPALVQRVQRGSIFIGPLATGASGWPPASRDSNIGFRCARVP
jgi:formylglycine-generating enzyme